MSYYLEIDGKETNSKLYSGILIESIRAVDLSLIKEDYKSTKEFFKPEYYEIDDKGNSFGCGEWVISKEGISLVIRYLQMIHEGMKGTNDTDYYFHEGNAEDVLWCYMYLVDVLTSMSIQNNSHAKLKWV